MKKYALPLVLTSVLVLQACNEQATNTEAVVAAPAAALESPEQRLSYGIAFGMGQRMQSESMPINVDAFSLGLRDALEGNESKMTQEEIAAELQTYRQKVVADQQAAAAVASETNLTAAAAFLAENATAEGVVVTESGLQYQVLEAGEGAASSGREWPHPRR